MVPASSLGGASGGGRYALVVGIGNYPEDSGWKRTSGDRDVHLVLDMLVRNGFPEDNIRVLADGAATKDAISSGFRNLERVLGKGDAVYIHFSGHGQQVTDMDGDEDDGLDEAFVPYDACRKYVSGVYEGENHIIDDELNEWLSGLYDAVGSEGIVFVSVDACHSGDATRGEADNWQFRGTSDIFEIPEREEDRPLQDKAGMREKVRWVSIGACKPYQKNYEFKSGDGFYGRLTWALYRSLEPGMTVDSLVGAVRNEYGMMPLPSGLPQNPDVEVAGNGARPLF